MSSLNKVFILTTIIFQACAYRVQNNQAELIKPKPIIIAHRGASGYLPEHTLPALAMAHAWGVDYVEPDVVLTKDNVPVVIHDIHLDTTTNVSEIFPNKKRADSKFYAIDFTLRELKQLSVHERKNIKNGKSVFEKRFPSEHAVFEIPTLEEYLRVLEGLNYSSGKNIGVYLELKAHEFHKNEDKDIQNAVVKILRDRKWISNSSRKLILQSFEPTLLKSLRSQLGEDVQLVQLIAENAWAETSVDYDAMRTPTGLLQVIKYANGVGPYIKHLYEIKDSKIMAKDFVQEAQRLGLIVHPYTHRRDSLPEGFTTDEQLYNFLFNNLRVDGLFSDFGDHALNYRNLHYSETTSSGSLSGTSQNPREHIQDLHHR